MELLNILSMWHQILFTTKNGDTFQSPFLSCHQIIMSLHTQKIILRRFTYMTVTSSLSSSMWNSGHRKVIFIKKFYIKLVVNRNKRKHSPAPNFPHKLTGCHTSSHEKAFFIFSFLCVCYCCILCTVIMPRGSCSHWYKYFSSVKFSADVWKKKQVNRQTTGTMLHVRWQWISP